MAGRTGLVGTDLVLVLLVAVISSRATAQSGCTGVIMSLSPCLGYTTGSSPAPSTACCSQLASVVQSQPQCLCAVAGGSAPFGIRINQTRALALPGACNVKTPPASECSTKAPSASAPTAPALAPTPAAAPAPSYKAPPPISGTTPGNGTKEVPSPSGGNTAKLNAAVLLSLLWIGSITTF